MSLAQRRGALKLKLIAPEPPQPRLEDKAGADCVEARYELHEILGSGSTATVRRATRRCDGVEVALKCVGSSDEEQKMFARKEYEILKSLNHSCIAAVREMIETPWALWLCMDLYKGGSLQNRVDAKGPFLETAGTSLINQLLECLAYLHGKRVVHRDVKPANVLLDEEGRQLCLTDFNSAKCIGCSEGASTMLTNRGTRDFSAPELHFSHLWCERVDIWAAGLTAYFSLKGKLPFLISDRRNACDLSKGRLPPIDWSGISAVMRLVLEQSLSVLPSDRPPAMELLMHPAFQMGRPLQTQVSTENALPDLGQDPVLASPIVDTATPGTIASKYGKKSFVSWAEPRDGETVMRQLVEAKCERAIGKWSSHRPRRCDRQKKSAKQFITTHGAVTMNCNSGQDIHQQLILCS